MVSLTSPREFDWSDLSLWGKWAFANNIFCALGAIAVVLDRGSGDDRSALLLTGGLLGVNALLLWFYAALEIPPGVRLSSSLRHLLVWPLTVMGIAALGALVQWYLVAR